jgi:endonuclease/exonuclease/phosphatase (EEP) superfamily protein YafD
VPPGDIPIAAPPRGAGIARRLLVVSSAVVCAVLAIVAAGRLAHLDDAVGWPYPGINAFTPFVYLPAYAAVAVAFAYRRNLLLLLAGAVVVTHLVWTVPHLVPGGPEAAPAGSSPVRVMTANLLYSNADAGRLGEQIRARNPDIVALEEVSALSLRSLVSSGALGGYPHRQVHQQEGAFGSAVFSRLPLRDPEVSDMAGLPLLQVTVGLTDARSFRLFVVHALTPTSSDSTGRWRAQLDDLRSRTSSADGPLVLAGDFNATPDHRPFRRLVDAGLRDAHDVAGAGWTPTWNAESLFPRMLRLDHVLATPAFAVTGYQVGEEFGSDHAPVTVDLALRP